MFVIELLAIFLIILAGNQMGYVGRWNWPFGNTPVSASLLGSHKTLGAYYAGALFGAAAATIEYVIPFSRHTLGFPNAQSAIIAGAFVGLSVVVGDHTNSFIKRRCGLPPGAPSFSDKVDWTLAGGLASLMVIPAAHWTHILVLVAVGYPIHVLGNKNSHKHGWRNTPH